MSRSKKWRLEWAFFLGENGRRKSVLIACPHYQSARSKKCGDRG